MEDLPSNSCFGFGFFVGAGVGSGVGSSVGSWVGSGVGASVGAGVGLAVSVGAGVVESNGARPSISSHPASKRIAARKLIYIIFLNFNFITFSIIGLILFLILSIRVFKKAIR